MWRTGMIGDFHRRFERAVVVAALALCAIGFSIVGAQALDIHQAKSQGLVGEQADGYVGIPNPPGSAEVQKLVADVNLQRRELYQKAAAAMSPPVSLEAYAAIAGAKLVQSAPSGEYVRGSDGKWVKK